MEAALAGSAAAAAEAQRLRPEQQQLLDEVLSDDGNVVVVAGTGFGKTRVAFAAVEAALRRHPRRVVVFLCPTVPLANQQRGYWDRCGLGGGRLTSAVVAGGGGGSGFNHAQVTFATPAKFVAHLVSGDGGGLALLALLVIDECHHAHRAEDSAARGESRHPYAEVAEIYRDCAARVRPKLLGLTASPGATRRDVVGLAAVLQARFVCAARGAEAETELAPAGRGARLLARRLEFLQQTTVELQKQQPDGWAERMA